MGSLGPEDFKKVEDCYCPTTLMCINDFEQYKLRYTIDQKLDKPMYIAKDEDKDSQDSSDDDIDDQKKKKSKLERRPRRIVAPPEYPFVYYRLRPDQRRPHCLKVGKECHNIRYGPYLAAVLARFHREHGEYYNEFDAVRLFVESYRVLSEFEDDHIERNAIKPVSYEHKLPDCIAFDSLVYALNAVEWTIMWGLTSNMVPDGDYEIAEEPEKKCKAVQVKIEENVNEE